MDTLQIEAFAKINLGLDVVRRLENGYHEVKMVMQTVGISDTITLKKIPGDICFFSESGEIPCDDTNLAYKAARLFLEALRAREDSGFNKDTSGTAGGVEISLKKRIPVAAGMAGGSTDAAAVLRGMNELFQAGFTTEELQKIGLKIGADVPYCIMGGTALAEGIGEKLTSLKRAKDMPLLVVKPDIFVSTKEVYQSLHLDENTNHPDIDGMVKAIEKEDSNADDIIPYMGNVLQDVTEKMHPIVRQIIDRMEAQGAKKAMMSGSGPSVFGIFETEEDAERAKESFADYRQVFVTRLV